jgi:Flp pilus assembly protein TadG
MHSSVSRSSIRGTASIRRRPRHSRRGVAAVESAIVLSTLLMVLFVLFDFGLATFQYNTLSAVARYMARAATLHGSAAPPQYSSWGPTEYVGTAADNSEIAAVAAPLLATMPAGGVAIDVTWPSGSNQESNTVQVRLSYTHTSLVPFLPGISSLNLQAQSTMSIAH